MACGKVLKSDAGKLGRARRLCLDRVTQMGQAEVKS